MKYTLLENGTDSLKGAIECLERYRQDLELTEHNLKDAIIFLNHGIELLLKFILKDTNPFLMFTNLDKYINAKEKMIKLGASDVFEVDPNLKTISLEEALKRVEFVCDIYVPTQLKGVVIYINKIRNQIMHYGIDLTEEEAADLIKKLNFCLDTSLEFLEEHIPELTKHIHYSRFDPRQYTLSDEELAQMSDEMETQGMIAYEISKEDAQVDMIEQLMQNEDE